MALGFYGHGAAFFGYDKSVFHHGSSHAGHFRTWGEPAFSRRVYRNIFNVDLSSANVVFLYLTTSANEKIKPKLETELKPGTRVVSHDYEILGWKAKKITNFCENPKLGYPSHTLYFYEL